MSESQSHPRNLQAVLDVLFRNMTKVVAFIELKPGATLDEAGLRTHLAGNLSPYKRPARIELIDAMPTTANGKLLKRELKARCVPAAG